MTGKPNGKDRGAPALAPSPLEGGREGSVKLRPLLALKPYVLRHKGMVAVALVSLFVAAAATLAVPLAVRRMIDVGFTGLEPDLVNKYFVTLLGVGLILAIASAARFYCVTWLGEHVVADIRADVFSISRA